VQSQTRLFPAWVTGQHWCKQHAQGFRPCACARMWVEPAESYSCKCSLNQGCFQLGLQGSSSMHSGSVLVSVQQCWSKLQNLTGVSAVSNKAVSSLGCKAALVQNAWYPEEDCSALVMTDCILVWEASPPK